MLYRDTEFHRSAVSQEIRQILLPEPEAPENSFREVQVVLPLDEPLVFMTTRPDADTYAGLNRTYKLPPLAPGAQIQFKLRRNQGLYAATESGLAEIALIVEHHQ